MSFVLYVDDILLANSDLGILNDTKIYLSENFDMKYMDEITYIIGIEISRDQSHGLLDCLRKAT